MSEARSSYPAQPLDVALTVLGREHLQVIVDLDRPIDRHEAERAVAGTVAAFPLLGCRYVPGAWRDRWVTDPTMSATDAVQLLDPAADPETTTREWLAREIDERAGWPWRVAVLPGERGCRLLVSVLHVAADGAGTLAAVRELARLLMGGTTVERPCPVERHVGMLFRRLGAAGLVRLAAGLLRETTRPFEVPFLARTATAGPPPTGPATWRTVRVDVGEGSALRELCRVRNATVNDLLVAALAVLVRRVSTRGRSGCFYTADLRRRLPDDRPRVANLSAVISVSLPRAHAASLPDALAEVARRTSRRRPDVDGLAALLFNLPLILCLPHGLVRRLTRLVFAVWIRRLLTRGLLVTNIGPLDPCLAPFGDLVRDATFVGPSVRGLPIPVLTATGFCGDLTIHFNGYAETAPELERLAAELETIFDDGRMASR
ncbi:MAG: hypothetical protein HY905_10825 [Deltaproteobacteria bacterium]|nr:hypothetical protein [Deltaproteobacteria bacterium]